jgi:adenylate cyclase class IV
LELLGFRPGFRYEKYRASFRLPNLHVDLDETPAGNFLELEGSPKAIERVAHALGYSAATIFAPRIGNYMPRSAREKDAPWEIWCSIGKNVVKATVFA